MSLEIKIKTKHFRESLGYVHSSHCPLALAIKDKLKLDGFDVSTSIGSARIQDKHYRVPLKWCCDQMVYHGKWKGVDIDTMIKMVKEDKTIKLPTITLTLTER